MELAVESTKLAMKVAGLELRPAPRHQPLRGNDSSVPTPKFLPRTDESDLYGTKHRTLTECLPCHSRTAEWTGAHGKATMATALSPNLRDGPDPTDKSPSSQQDLAMISASLHLYSEFHLTDEAMESLECGLRSASMRRPDPSRDSGSPRSGKRAGVR